MKLYSFHMKFDDGSECDNEIGAESFPIAITHLPEFDLENLQSIECVAESREREHVIWWISDDVENLFLHTGQLIKAASILNTELATKESKKSQTCFLELDHEVMNSLSALSLEIERRANEIKRKVEIMTQLSRRSGDIFQSKPKAVNGD